MIKKIKHYAFILCLFLLNLYSLALTYEISFAEEKIAIKEAIFSKDVQYDIYYRVSDIEVDYVENVKVEGTTIINGLNFLIVRRHGALGYEKSAQFPAGFIIFDSIKAILPSDSLKPKRIFNKEDLISTPQKQERD